MCVEDPFSQIWSHMTEWYLSQIFTAMHMIFQVNTILTYSPTFIGVSTYVHDLSLIKIHDSESQGQEEAATTAKKLGNAQAKPP